MTSPIERGFANLLHSILVRKSPHSRHSHHVFLRRCIHFSLSKSLPTIGCNFRPTKVLRPCIVPRQYSSSSTNIVESPFPKFDIPEDTVPEFVWKNAESFQEFPAMVCGVNGRGYSGGGVKAVSRKFAAALVKSGLKPGDTLTIILPNVPEYLIILLGALEAGLIVATANPIYKEYELCHQFSNSDTNCIVTLPSLVPVCKRALEELKKNVPIITLSYEEEKLPGTWDFQDMVTANVDESLIPKGCRKSEDTAFLLYSSGTTGLSKGVILTHRNIVSNLCMMNAPGVSRVRPPTTEHQDVLMGVLPFFHSFGLTVLLINCYLRGAKIVSFPKFDPVTYLKVLSTQKPSTTLCYCAPPLVQFLGLHPSVTVEHLEAVRIVLNGAGPVGISDIEKLLEKCPKNDFKFYNAYGLTETSPAAIIPHFNCKNLLTIGSPVANSQARVVDETGKNVGPNEKGELYLKGPHILKKYNKNEEATKNAFDETGWFKTGDQVYYDEEHNFFIVERLKELIKVKGYQVPPAELEALLRSHPEVADSAVIGVPDKKTGEKPIAFIVSRGKPIDADEIKKFIVERVAPYKQISEIIQLDAIPKNPTGKILRRVLKEEYLSKNS